MYILSLSSILWKRNHKQRCNTQQLWGALSKRLALLPKPTQDAEQEGWEEQGEQWEQREHKLQEEQEERGGHKLLAGLRRLRIADL